MKRIPVYTIRIPEYDVKSKPDWDKIGAKLDIILKKHFLNKKIAVRGLGSQQHRKKDINNLIKTIKKLGHDRYNVKRKGHQYENIENKKIDIFCLDWTVKTKSKMMWQFIWSFYKFPIEEGKRPIKVDLFIIYDLNKLKRVKHKYEGRKDTKTDGFIFKDQDNKKDALLGIIKII